MQLVSLPLPKGAAYRSMVTTRINVDFKLGRKIETVETYLNLVKVCIIKNILIGVSEERVLIYDLETK